MVQLLWRRKQYDMVGSQNLKLELSYNLAIPILGIPKELHTHVPSSSIHDSLEGKETQTPTNK